MNLRDWIESYRQYYGTDPDDPDEDNEEEGINPMDKKFYVTHTGISGFKATYDEALDTAKRKAANDGDYTWVVLQAVATARAKSPDVDVTTVTA